MSSSHPGTPGPEPDPVAAKALPLGRLRCGGHADRAAAALCVTCRRPLCSECTTTWDGMHLCRSCLGKMSTGPKTGSRVLPVASLLLALALLVGGFFVRSALLLVLAEVL